MVRETPASTCRALSDWLRPKQGFRTHLKLLKDQFPKPCFLDLAVGSLGEFIDSDVTRRLLVNREFPSGVSHDRIEN